MFSMICKISKSFNRTISSTIKIYGMLIYPYCNTSSVLYCKKVMEILLSHK